MVVALVRPVLHVREDGGPEGPALVGQVDPVMRCYFKLSLVGCWMLNRTYFPVVCGQIATGCEWKDGFQVRRECIPVDGFGELDLLASAGSRQPHRLHELRSATFAGNLYGHSCRTVLYDADLCR